MRELTVRIRFTTHSIGNVKIRDGRFLLPRTPDGLVQFLPTWHRENMRFASMTLGRHHDEVGKISWDPCVDAVIHPNAWYRRYDTQPRGSKARYSLHEAFLPDQVIGINCVVPSAIPSDDFWSLFDLVGRYRGLSPYGPTQYGFFAVDTIRNRRLDGDFVG